MKTLRLSLVRLTEQDAPFVLVLYNEPTFLEFIGDKGVRTLDAAREDLQKGALASYELHGFGMYKVELLSGEAIGMCGLIQRDFLPVPDIGYAFFPQFTGQGYAFEAATRVLEHAKALGISKLQAIVSPENTASKKLLEKLKMQAIDAVFSPTTQRLVDAYQREL